MVIKQSRLTSSFDVPYAHETKLLASNYISEKLEITFGNHDQILVFFHCRNHIGHNLEKGFFWRHGSKGSQE